MILVFSFFSITDVSFWLFSIRTRERRYWEGSVHAVHYKSRKSHLQVGRVSWLRDHQYAQIFGSLVCNVATFQRRDVETSRCPFYPSLSHRDVDFQRRDVNFHTLCHVATWISNVAPRRDFNFHTLWNVTTWIYNVTTSILMTLWNVAT